MKDYHEDKPFLSHSLKRLDEDITWNINRKMELEKRIIRDLDRQINYSYARKGIKVLVPSIVSIMLVIGGIYLLPDLLSNLDNQTTQETPSNENPKNENLDEEISKNPNIDTNTKKLLDKYKDQINIPLDLFTQMPKFIKEEHPLVRVTETPKGFGVTLIYAVKYGTLNISQNTINPELSEPFDPQEIMRELKFANGDERVTMTETNGYTTILVNFDEKGNIGDSMIQIVSDYNVYAIYGSQTIDELLDIARQTIIGDDK